MAAEDEGRTEQATPKRLQEARGKGNIPTSREFISLIPIWVLFLFFSYSGIAFFNGLLVFFRASLKRGFEVSMSDTALAQIFRNDITQVGHLMLPMFAWMIIVAAAIHFYQTDFYFSMAKLMPENAGFLNMNPLNSIKRMFSKSTLFELAKGALKVTILGTILYFILKKELVNFPLMIDMDVPTIASLSFSQIRKLMLISASILSIFAIADYFYQRWQYDEQMKMTKMDVKDEMKSSEGDPQVKSRIRSLQRQMAMKRMMQEVPKADVVITNPTHFAVALKYDVSKMGAPTVVAKGTNLIAERIKEIAKKNNVTVFEDKPLARTLFKLDIGQEIPEMLYKAVAAILANVYKLKGKGIKGHA